MKGRLGRYLPLLVIWLPLLINAGHVVGFTAWTTWLSFTSSDLLPDYEWAGLRSYRAVMRSENTEVAYINLVLYGVGFVGLYRLAPWGAILNALTSVIVFLLALSSPNGLDSAIRTIILILTGVHALAAAPMLVSLFTGLRLPQASPRVRARLGAAIILCVVAVSITGALELVGIR